ncbi:Protein adenylyltransferase SelO [Labeo rohita]|uniref:Protein adenylyltransferase SelO n=1 Tax=Labeo rohita TaxID=84645 RepID=A0ABQ8MCW6_LABRO|nr:Protein adenylyltransferase SelO [Labeo rohita]
MHKSSLNLTGLSGPSVHAVPAVSVPKVCAEFQRITNQNLTNTFYAELDRHKQRRLEKLLMHFYDLKDQHDVHTRRTTALCALPVYLREDTSKFFKICTIEDDSEEPDVDSSVALLTVIRELPDIAVRYNTEKILIILENGVKVLLGLDDGKLKPRVLALKNDLLIHARTVVTVFVGIMAVKVIF